MRGLVLQYLAAISAALLTSAGAVTNMWSSPVLPQLLKDDSPIGVKVTKDEASLISSLLLFGSILGNLILGPCIDYFGRRGTLLLVSIPIFVCWCMIIFAHSVAVLYVARFVQGIFVAAPMAVVMLYIGEIADAKIRGRLSLISCIFSECASILTVFLGSIISYKMLGMFGATIPVIFFLIFYWMPESPYFYVKTGDFEKAEKSLKMFRDNRDVTEELSKMKKTVHNDLSEKGMFLDLFRVHRFKRGVFLILGLKTIHQLSGIAAINLYMKTIFEDSTTGLNADVSSVISISVGIPAIFLASYAVDKVGRKPLYYISTLGSTFSLLVEAIFFFLHSSGKLDLDNPIISWLPTSGIFLFHIFKSFGISTLPTLYLGEMFPPQVKGYATSLSLVYASSLASLIGWGFPGFSETFGYGVSFIIFAAFCFGGFFFVWMLLPETKGKILAEIQIKENEENFD